MREIGRYRGKTKDGKWVKGYYLVLLDGTNIIIQEAAKTAETHPHYPAVSLGKYHEVIPETVCQNTGLCDKKRKQDLYAGDRVVIGNDRGVLVWDDYDLCWALQPDSDDSYQSYQAICCYYSYEEIEDIEYIGNIHDKETSNQGPVGGQG